MVQKISQEQQTGSLTARQAEQIEHDKNEEIEQLKRTFEQ
jgi:hypothetical protein